MMYANVIKTRSCPRTHRVIIAKIESDLYILPSDETTRDQTKTKIKRWQHHPALPCAERFSSQTALLNLSSSNVLLVQEHLRPQSECTQGLKFVVAEQHISQATLLNAQRNLFRSTVASSAYYRRRHQAEHFQLCGQI